MLLQILGPADSLSIGTLYILDDGRDAAVVRLKGQSPDLWIVDRFSDDGTVRRCALWHPRAAITVQLDNVLKGQLGPVFSTRAFLL